VSVLKSYRRLSKAEIEQSANDLLVKMQATSNFPKWPGIAERAVNFLQLSIVWDKIPKYNGQPVAARIYPTERLIEINEDMPELQNKDGFIESTKAHEVGHWRLHVNQDEADGLIKQLELPLNIVDNKQPFLCRSVTEQKITTYDQQQWIEWQAQYFASCLLMPRYKLEEIKNRFDLTNWKHLYAMSEELGVTISNLTNRLKELELVYIPEGSRQIYLSKQPSSEQKKLL
jgi:Zn-dependent peptidase ImmA (M78 family)